MNQTGSGSEAVSAPARELRVVLVDDSDLFRRALARLLRVYCGIRVAAEAANGRDGFALAARLQPDLIITDLEMPELDGLRLIELLRREYPSMRSILVSCHDGPALHAHSLRHGADAFIPKECLPTELPGLLASLFPAHTPRGAAAAPCNGRPAPQTSQGADGHRLPPQSPATPQTRIEAAQLNPQKNKQ